MPHEHMRQAAWLAGAARARNVPRMSDVDTMGMDPDEVAYLERVEAARTMMVDCPQCGWVCSDHVCPPRCTRDRAGELLAHYDLLRREGFKNQEIAARDRIRRLTGMSVRDLRKWLNS